MKFSNPLQDASPIIIYRPSLRETYPSPFPKYPTIHLPISCSPAGVTSIYQDYYLWRTLLELAYCRLLSCGCETKRKRKEKKRQSEGKGSEAWQSKVVGTLIFRGFSIGFLLGFLSWFVCSLVDVVLYCAVLCYFRSEGRDEWVWVEGLF